VVKVPWDAREQRSCISDYWQIAFLHLQVRKNAHEHNTSTDCENNNNNNNNDRLTAFAPGQPG